LTVGKTVVEMQTGFDTNLVGRLTIMAHTHSRDASNTQNPKNKYKYKYHLVFTASTGQVSSVLS